MKVRASKSSIEGGLDEDTEGVGVRGKRFYLYRRDRKGRYATRQNERPLPQGVPINPYTFRSEDVEKREEYIMGLPGRYQPSDAAARRNLRDKMRFGSTRREGEFDRDLRILICIGTVIVVFILCYTILNMVFDALIDLGGTLSLDMLNLTNFRTEASLVLGTVVALIVGSGAAMFLFKEDEVNDTIFEA